METVGFPVDGTAETPVGNGEAYRTGDSRPTLRLPAENSGFPGLSRPVYLIVPLKVQQ